MINEPSFGNDKDTSEELEAKISALVKEAKHEYANSDEVEDIIDVEDTGTPKFGIRKMDSRVNLLNALGSFSEVLKKKLIYNIDQLCLTETMN